MISLFVSAPARANAQGRGSVRHLGAWVTLFVLAMTSLAAEAITLTAVQSRKVHGTAGTFNVEIDLAQAIGGAVSVESRDIGAGHQIVFHFDGAVASFGTPAAVDENGVAIGTLTPQIAGNDVVVAFTDVPDNKRVRIVLPAVNGGADAVASMGFLVGDVNNSRSTSPADMQQIKSRAGQVADVTNFRFDLNTSGAISATDIVAIKSRTPRSLPDLGVLPTFTTQPGNATITVGQTAQFVAAASGVPAPTLKWQVSTDGGVNWSDIAGANSSPLNIVGALSDSGRQYRAMASNAVGSAISNTAILTVNGVPVPKAWQPASLISAPIDGDVYNYQLAVSSNGDAMAVWQDLVSASVGTNILASHYTPGTGWGAATIIEGGAFDARDPQVALDASGNAIVVWAQSDGVFDYSSGNPAAIRYNIWSNRYVPGTGWTGATLIETLDGDNFYSRSTSQPQIAVAANGQAIAAWTQGNQFNSGADVWANSYTLATGWSAATLLSNGTISAGGVKVAMDTAANSMAVWSQVVGTHINLFASRNFGVPVQIETGTGNPGVSQVVSNPSGETFVVWNQGCVTWANRFVPATGWGLAGALQTGSPTCAYSPDSQIGVDANGNAIAAWVLNTGASITTYGNRYNTGSGWQGASPINYGGFHFQFALNARGNVLSAWLSGSILAGNGDFVTGYNFFPSVLVYGGTGIDATGSKLAIDANGNAIVLFKRAEVAGVRNTVWAAVFR